MKTWTTKNGYEVIRLLSGRCNAFLVTNREKYILVDTGRTNQWNRLYGMLETFANGGGYGDFAALVLTHTHFDHAENAADVKAKFNLPVVVNNREEDLLRQGESPPICGAVPGVRLATNYIFREDRNHYKYKPVHPGILVDEELELSTFGLPHIRVIHTPGHTSGSQSLIVDDEIALVGDAMFGIFPRSVFPPFAEDRILLVKSWGRLLETECRVFIPAHGTENSRELLMKEYRKYKQDERG